MKSHVITTGNRHQTLNVTLGEDHNNMVIHILLEMV